AGGMGAQPRGPGAGGAEEDPEGLRGPRPRHRQDRLCRDPAHGRDRHPRGLIAGRSASARIGVSVGPAAREAADGWRARHMINASVLAAWSPRMLSVLRIVSGLIFLLHGSQKLLGVPPREGPGPELMSQMGLGGVIELVAG